MSNKNSSNKSTHVNCVNFDLLSPLGSKSSSELSSAYLGFSLMVLLFLLFIFTLSQRGMVDSISANSSGGSSFQTAGSIPPTSLTFLHIFRNLVLY